MSWRSQFPPKGSHSAEGSNSSQFQSRSFGDDLDSALEQSPSHGQQQGHDFSQIPVVPKSAAIQPKLTVGEPNDQYEQEADQVADQVMRMSAPPAPPAPLQRQGIDVESDAEDSLQTKPLASSITPLVQRQAISEDEDAIQPKSESAIVQRLGDGAPDVGNHLEQQLNSGSGGSPLPDDVRSFMETRFQSDFSGVQVHTGSAAVQMNRDLGAQAFTHKQNIYYGAGKSPGKDALTAHELTHVVQQTGAAQMKPNPTVQRQPDPNRASSAIAGLISRGPSVIQRSLTGIHNTGAGEFIMDMKTKQQAVDGVSGLDGSIKFRPFKNAPYSNQIGLIQIVKLSNLKGGNEDVATLPTARGPSLRTTEDKAGGVEGGYFTDVLHNASKAAVATGTDKDAPAGSALPLYYPFGKGPAQPFSSGGGGQIFGFKRSDNLADIKSAELTDAPGTPIPGDNVDFNFETVAKGDDTMQVYGAVKWGFSVRGGKFISDHESGSPAQSATFDAAIEKHRDFYVHEPVTFYFDFNSDTPPPAEIAKIDTFLDYLRRFPDVRLNLQGFADIQGGSGAYNEGLALNRAEAIAQALLSKGISADRINPPTANSGGTTSQFTKDARPSRGQGLEVNRRGNRRVMLTFEHTATVSGP